MAPKIGSKATPKLDQKLVQKLIQSWGALGPILGPILGPKTTGSGGPFFKVFSGWLRSTILAPSWPHFGSILPSLGLILAPSWPLLALSWPHFGLILALLASLGALLASSWPCLGPLSCTWPHLGPSWLHISCKDPRVYLLFMFRPSGSFLGIMLSPCPPWIQIYIQRG